MPRPRAIGLGKDCADSGAIYRLQIALPDGTMIVVNHARAFLGKVVTVTVSSALQTGAGRLIFAEVKQSSSPPVMDAK